MAAPASDVDSSLIRRAIGLAVNGRGGVEPNPMVGCVIVKDRQVIGEGYHQQYGCPHAEPNALAGCTAPPAGATVYVTLEPCCHTNKQTPPCAPRLIEAKIARVVIGCLDPNPAVNGKGVRMLREAGVQVDGPVLEAEAKQLIAPFLARVVHQRPYITLKWAQTADGKIAGPGGRRLQISNERSSQLVHQLRARCDAIVVGINTVLADDPLLTARSVDRVRPLQRWVLDRHLRIPLDSRLVKTAGDVTTTIACSATAALSPKAIKLADHSVTVQAISDLQGLGVEMLRRAVTHALVESGPTLAKAFFDENRCDRLWVFRSEMRAEDLTAPQAAEIPSQFVATSEMTIDGDRLTEYLNVTSPVFFATVPSADIVLA